MHICSTHINIYDTFKALLYLTKHNMAIRIVPRTRPALLNASGMARAPAPTIKLKTYMNAN